MGGLHLDGLPVGGGGECVGQTAVDGGADAGHYRKGSQRYVMRRECGGGNRIEGGGCRFTTLEYDILARGGHPEVVIVADGRGGKQVFVYLRPAGVFHIR